MLFLFVCLTNLLIPCWRATCNSIFKMKCDTNWSALVRNSLCLHFVQERTWIYMVIMKSFPNLADTPLSPRKVVDNNCLAQHRLSITSSEGRLQTALFSCKLLVSCGRAVFIVSVRMVVLRVRVKLRLFDELAAQLWQCTFDFFFTDGGNSSPRITRSV